MGLLRSCSLVLLIACFAATAANNRKINMTMRQCPKTICPGHNVSIIHVQAKASEDNSTIHYLWTTYPVPTIIVAYTMLDNTLLHISWKELIHGNATGIEFHPEVNYTVGFALSRIYEYEDGDDKAELSSSSKIVTHKLSDMEWMNAKVDESSSKVTFTGNKTLVFECTASDSEGRESSLPHALHTADSSRFSLTLNNMKLSTNKTRFAFEFSYVVRSGQNLSVHIDKSIDDEYTPAVFETIYGKVSGGKGKSYTQWKPIAYTLPKLGRMCQTRASAGDVATATDRSWNIGDLVMPGGKYKTYGLNVSFGLSKDGFYQKNKYLTWSGIVGYGDPAKSALSFLVILIISIGLGLPLAIIIFGGTYVQIRKYCLKPKVSTSYESIN